MLRQRIPLVWLLDSAGARIQSTKGSTFAGMGALFREQVALSGVVPQVAAMLGHCAAGTAYIPALADFVPMVKGTSSMALGGRHLVRAATGEDVTEEEMGGSEVHTKVSGVADLEVGSDEECLAVVRQYLSFFPSHNQEPPPGRPSRPIRSTAASSRSTSIVPTAPRRAYDMVKVIQEIVDDGEFFPMKPAWARNIVTGLARVGGRPVGIVASQPMVLGGALDVNAADKAARFVWLCDAFDIPLVFLHDVPGFIVGSAVEKQGIIRHGAKMLFAVSEATVPKVSIVLRKSYGAGYFVMNGREYEADYIAVWPTAEIAVMGPDGMVEITQRRVLDQLEGKERDAEKIRMAEELRKGIDPYIAAGWAKVDDVIDPADTRLAIWQGLQVSQTKHRRPPLAQARRASGLSAGAHTPVRAETRSAPPARVGRRGGGRRRPVRRVGHRHQRGRAAAAHGAVHVARRRRPRWPPTTTAADHHDRADDHDGRRPPPTAGRRRAARPAPALAAPSPVEQVVAFALAQRGQPYRKGAAGPAAFDCSGLTRAAYATVGVDLPHYSVTQARRGPGRRLAPRADRGRRPRLHPRRQPGDRPRPRRPGRLGDRVGGGVAARACPVRVEPLAVGHPAGAPHPVERLISVEAMGRPPLSRKLEGFGTTIFAEMSALAAATGAVNLGQGFPDTDGPREVLDAAVAAMRSGQNQYPPGPGIAELRHAIADHQRRFYGLEVDPDSEVFVTTGATEAIAASLLGLLDPGDEVIAFEPYYDSYAACIAMAGAVRRPVTLRTPDFVLDHDELRRAVTPRTRLILLNTPHNPIGKVFSPRRPRGHRRGGHRARPHRRRRRGLRAPRLRRRARARSRRCRAWPSAPSPSRRRARRSRSPAGRSGWVCAPPELVAAVRTAKQFLTYVSGAPFQPAVAVGPAPARLVLRGVHQRPAHQAGPHVRRPGGGRASRVLPAGRHVLHHDRHPAVRRAATAWPSAASLPERCGVVAVPNVVFYDDKEEGVAARALRLLQAPRGDRRGGRPPEGPGPVKVAAVQHDICWEAPDETAAHVTPMIAAAAAAGARLVVLTEMFATGFSMASERIAQAPDGPSATFLADQAAAHGVWLAASVPTADPALPRPVNRLVVAGPGGRAPPLRQDPPVLLRRRARALRRRVVVPHHRHRRRPGERLRLLRPPLRRRVLGRGAGHRLLRRRRQLAGGPAPPLALAARGPGHREPGLRGGREPGGDRRRRARATPATR